MGNQSTTELLNAEHLASLPWYNFPSTRSTLDAVWHEACSQLVAHGLTDIPLALDHQLSYRKLAACPKLLLAQCCGLDLFQPFTSNVVPIAAPVLSAIDVPDGKYFSFVVTRQSIQLLEPLKVAVNDYSSHSGYTAVLEWLSTNALQDFSTFATGSHAQSVKTVQQGDADLAAVDAFTWQFLDTRGLSILGKSEPVTAPPFITGAQSNVPMDLLVGALDRAFAKYGHRIGITGVKPASKQDYRQIADQAAAHGILITKN